MLLALGALYMLGVATLTLAPAALLLHHLRSSPPPAIALQTLPALHLALCVASQRLLVGHVPPGRAGRRRRRRRRAGRRPPAARPLFGASLALWRGAIVPTYRYLGLRVGHLRGVALSALQFGCRTPFDIEIGAGALVGAGAPRSLGCSCVSGRSCGGGIAVRPHFAALRERAAARPPRHRRRRSTRGALTVAAPRGALVAEFARGRVAAAGGGAARRALL